MALRSRFRCLTLTVVAVLAWCVYAPQLTPAAPVEVDPDAGAAEILVSRQLLEARGLAIGEVVRLGTDRDGNGSREFRIAGTYEPVPDPMKITHDRFGVRLHLPDLQDLIADPDDPHGAESVGAINVALSEPSSAEAFARDLELRAPGLYAFPTEAPEGSSATFVVLERFHLAIALVTVLGSTAFLLALMVMRADERREAVGIMRLIGFSKRRILVEVLLEGLMIAIPGALFGVVLAVATQGIVNEWCQWRYDTTLTFVRVTPGIAWRCVVLAVPLGVLAGLVASWGLLRRDVLELMRR